MLRKQAMCTSCENSRRVTKNIQQAMKQAKALGAWFNSLTTAAACQLMLLQLVHESLKPQVSV